MIGGNPKHIAISLLQKCLTSAQLKQAHAHLITHGLAHHPAIARPIILISSRQEPGDMDYASMAFSKLCKSNNKENLFLCNSMIRGFAQGKTTQKAFIFYIQLLHTGFSPNNFTFTFLVQACAVNSELVLNLGRQAHCQTFKFGFQTDIYIRNSLISMYSINGELESSSCLFNEFPEFLDVVSWNSMIDGYIRNGKIIIAGQLFDQMPEKNVVSWNCMIKGYASFDQIEKARKLFDECNERNSISWATMMSAYSHSGRPKEALSLFQEMQVSKLKPNHATMVSVLSSCAQLGALDEGRWAHSYIHKHNLKLDPILETALIDMYSKCGDVENAIQIFRQMPQKTVFSYTSMVLGMAMHGHGTDALKTFEQMKRDGITPDSVTFVAVLCACSHMGWVEKGWECFDSMISEYQIEPELDHYTCMVHLLGRAGLLEEAKRLMDSMPMEPDHVMYGALLGACRIHGNFEMGERVGKKLMEFNDHGGGRYVLLSNLYAASSMAEDARGVRKFMRKRRIRTTPGCSLIEVNGTVREFMAGDRMHQEIEGISMASDELARQSSAV
ncbi:pentatricopeptide repeat-containing protein At5g66520-like [Amborella trichopoda]|uniref:pentatricopeptide repeat-containing protein At5g66520-like n=1 Tax=Amborella trichopoda TaxID=13333 RepID=UPI0009C09DD6|nr:pentatricopeptide repeat-containing protein At5g66520-like [Amborella trichopoda]XP_020526850.1 pentatricopeptide repeat-containing protein At5g66520-like [Amborella trichopoda]|eukprot:XP_011625831.2 pentatricopeptide repeat-containing protein At5g66520-like [Amborella trichopoda]